MCFGQGYYPETKQPVRVLVLCLRMLEREKTIGISVLIMASALSEAGGR